MCSTPLDVTDDGLAAFMDVDVLDRHFLLPLSTISVEGLHLCGESHHPLLGNQNLGIQSIKPTKSARPSYDGAGLKNIYNCECMRHFWVEQLPRHRHGRGMNSGHLCRKHGFKWSCFAKVESTY